MKDVWFALVVACCLIALTLTAAALAVFVIIIA